MNAPPPAPHWEILKKGPDLQHKNNEKLTTSNTETIKSKQLATQRQ